MSVERAEASDAAWRSHPCCSLGSFERLFGLATNAMVRGHRFTFAVTYGVECSLELSWYTRRLFSAPWTEPSARAAERRVPQMSVGIAPSAATAARSPSDRDAANVT